MAGTKIENYDEYCKAKNAYYNGLEYNGMTGPTLFRAISNYSGAGAEQHFGSNTMEGYDPNKAKV